MIFGVCVILQVINEFICLYELLISILWLKTFKSISTHYNKDNAGMSQPAF